MRLRWRHNVWRLASAPVGWNTRERELNSYCRVHPTRRQWKLERVSADERGSTPAGWFPVEILSTSTAAAAAARTTTSETPPDNAAWGARYRLVAVRTVSVYRDHRRRAHEQFDVLHPVSPPNTACDRLEWSLWVFNGIKG